MARPTVFVTDDVVGAAGQDLLAAWGGHELSGQGWHLVWATTTHRAFGRLESGLRWRGRIDFELDARHVMLNEPGHPPQRVLVA